MGDADLDRILADLRRRRAEIDEMIRRNTKPGETSDGGEKEEEPIRSEADDSQ